MTAHRPRLLAIVLTLPLLAGQASGAPVAKAPKPAPAPNCALTAPPPDAGVDASMGMLIKVYPRNPDIGPAYAGCQTLWAQDEDGWSIVTIAHYARGHVAWIDSPQAEHDAMAECRVDDDGKVTRGDPALCAQLDEVRFESLPAACLLDTLPAGQSCDRR